MTKKKLINVWTAPPIDWWSGMIDLSKHAARDFAQSQSDALAFEKEVHELLSGAERIALAHGWEGDMSQGPFLSAIPNGDGHVDLIVAWKQSNNGTCFVASHTMLAGRGFERTIPFQDY